MNYIILSEKPIHALLCEGLAKRPDENWTLISSRAEFTLNNLEKIGPSKIFIPHWSYYIPAEVFTSYELILFHMTDLPFGRGGSPLQNLIVRGFSDTVVSAIHVTQEVDAGDVYLKKTLSLEGSAEEIFKRCNDVIKNMIIEILDDKCQPIPQKGEAVYFERRQPHQSNLDCLKEVREVYDHIRMLDAEGYPNAFLESEHFRFEFTKAVLNTDQNEIQAHVRIFKK